MADLKFIVLKINDVDVSQLSQNETVQMFLKASDPIVIEVSRNRSAQSKQTDFTNEEIMNGVDADLEKLHISTVGSESPRNDSTCRTLVSLSATKRANEPLMLTVDDAFAEEPVHSSKLTQTENAYYDMNQHAVNESADKLIEEEHNLFEQCLAPDIDIEEITLRKSNSNERLGLTVCYSGCNNTGNALGSSANGTISGSDETETCSEVYISDIQRDSIAGRDGRLRQGDQILQINGKDIKSREETETLIAENTNAVTLLVSRYIYTDEDFNDNCVGDIDVVVDVDIEDDDDDDDEEEEYYDDNNLDYENCFISNDYKNDVDELNAAILSQVVQQANLSEEQKVVEIPEAANSLATMKMSAVSLACREKFSANRSDGEQPGMISSDKNIKVQEINQKADFAKGRPKTNTVNNSDYESEHIYETIPEDSESEPFYCSPYESASYMASTTDALKLQQQKQRVAQWLGIKANAHPTATAPRQSVRSSSGCGRSLTQYDATSSFNFARSVNDTMPSGIMSTINGSSSSGGCVAAGCNNNIAATHSDEHDNSSSAYNTGGSNNSASPIVVLNHISAGGLDEEKVEGALVVRSKAHRLQSPKENIDLNKTRMVPLRTLESKAQELSIRQNLSSTTRNTIAQQLPPKAAVEKSLMAPQSTQQRAVKQLKQKHVQLQPQQIQQLPEQQLQHMPYFTAPNLSQYHFVSSQEVEAARLNALSVTVDEVASSAMNDECMVWKVKRRQDGTRYIVRRPARNRILRDRTLIRLNTARDRHNVTTTEDDTISEVKKGRYWSKEDRKRHIERARERRQQQQQNQLNQFERKLHQQHRERMSTAQLQSQTLQFPSAIQVRRQASTKPLQQHQLQFRSVETKQLNSINALSIATMACDESLLTSLITVTTVPPSAHISNANVDDTLSPLEATPLTPTTVIKTASAAHFDDFQNSDKKLQLIH